MKEQPRKSNLQYKLGIFEIIILNTKPSVQKTLRTRKILRTRNFRRKFIKNLLPEKRKENM